jgi:hypothetical protein
MLPGGWQIVKIIPPGVFRIIGCKKCYFTLNDMKRFQYFKEL